MILALLFAFALPATNCEIVSAAVAYRRLVYILLPDDFRTPVRVVTNWCNIVFPSQTSQCSLLGPLEYASWLPFYRAGIRLPLIIRATGYCRINDKPFNQVLDGNCRPMWQCICGRGDENRDKTRRCTAELSSAAARAHRITRLWTRHLRAQTEGFADHS
jgi:hypothetical protein